MDKGNSLILELIDKRESGFVLDGTQGTPNEQRIDYSERCYFPNIGKAAREKKDEKGQVVKDAKGNPVIEYADIRYIPGDSSIWVEDQERRRVSVNPRDTNKLYFEKNLMVIPDSPGTRTLREFMLVNFANGEAPNRPSTADALYKVVKLDKKADKVNEEEGVIAEAWYKATLLRKKDGKGGYIYDEDNINSYAKLLNVHGGDSPSEKLVAITHFAKTRPSDFLRLITVFDNTVATEVHEALSLKVISVEDGVATFSDSEKVIKPLGSEKLTKDEKIAVIADFLKTPEGNQHLTEMRAKISVEKEKKLANKIK